MQLEQELKLLLTEREFELIFDSRKGKSHTHQNFYFWNGKPPVDSLVRIRKTEQGSYFLTLKQRLSNASDIWVSNEYNAEITQGLFEKYVANGLSHTEISQVLAVDFFEDLKFCGCLTTCRTTIDICGLSVELDKNFYCDITDFELECECNDFCKLENLKDVLIRKFAILLRPSSPKSKRFFDALNAQN